MKERNRTDLTQAGRELVDAFSHFIQVVSSISEHAPTCSCKEGEELHDEIAEVVPLHVPVPTVSKPANPLDTLTRREAEILKLVVNGHSNLQLAKILWVTEQTIKFHLSNIYRKLDVANRTEASSIAFKYGLIEETG